MTQPTDNFARLREVMANCFAIAPAEITPTTQQSDIAAWDSVQHLNLMLMIEDTFGLSLRVEDMTKLSSVPAIMKFLG